MDVLIQSTKEFEKDLEGFNSSDKSNIINAMNSSFALLKNDNGYLFNANTLSQLRSIKLNHNYDSSLYSLRIDSELRVILTIDNDPIFQIVNVTLFRLVRACEASKAYNSVAKSIYKDLILNQEEVEV
ncbi:hypothetical protein G7B40_038180 [Aetokthonos hydrillicola Thurmond2011]|jgi:hypothetical protein|uniref:Uncharacterized protein n=1 Tax=Aetokthonos hydrillicola Thurmond2011 TaxID=2712845 RepID=A0AAP5IGB2_9CYAN|nr:hypothetical protein [Aetokthonos hydrillicola]MBO3463067.1 hypothetical protein [Aetokthonos hydrillicola CCALA 1050]MBW4591109.1 hypothetical protein [Aetokthonos hydrillicola CCALA 1050]MDR9900337.1 hypothetical protein [Aetokthonos hydrillicola Thurmond2011]